MSASHQTSCPHLPSACHSHLRPVEPGWKRKARLCHPLTTPLKPHSLGSQHRAWVQCLQNSSAADAKLFQHVLLQPNYSSLQLLTLTHFFFFASYGSFCMEHYCLPDWDFLNFKQLIKETSFPWGCFSSSPYPDVSWGTTPFPLGSSVSHFTPSHLCSFLDCKRIEGWGPLCLRSLIDLPHIVGAQ